MPSQVIEILDPRELGLRFTVIDRLDVLTGWSISGAGATQALDTVNFREGVAAYKMTVPASIAAQSSKSFGPINLQGQGLTDHIRFWLYIDNVSRVSSAAIWCVDNQGSPVTASYTLTGLVNGWQRFSIAKSAFTNGGTVRWSTIASVKFNVTATAGGTVNVTWDMLRMMLGPTINYTSGVWDESGATADVVDEKLKFFSTGVWTRTLALPPSTLYRLDGDATITLDRDTGLVSIGGLDKSITLLEIALPDFVGATRLKFMQPALYMSSAIMDAIRGAQGEQVDKLLSAILDMGNQSFIANATYMLDELEVSYGAGLGSAGFSLGRRRGRILARSTQPTPMNIVGMKALAELFVTATSVTHDPATYSFTIQVTDPKGIPPNQDELEAAVNRVKPAHLGVTFTYTFTTWDQMDGFNKSWDSAETYTWDALEVASS